MKKIMAFLVGLYVMPACADSVDFILTTHDNTFYAQMEPFYASAGMVTGFADTYYYYDPVNMNLTVKRTDFIADGNGGEEPRPHQTTFNYTNVGFDDICYVMGGACDRDKIYEMQREYEEYLNDPERAENKVQKEIHNRIVGDSLTLKKAKTYTDEKNDALTELVQEQNMEMLHQANVQANIDDEMILKRANEYTDQAVGIFSSKMDDLEKDLSAGIASSNAMSAVAVSNVARGEVSVGGGYGSYNNRSAVAVGAAIGLTDHWSVNTAAGMADSNVSFRAGTNYKFKLF